MCPTVATKAVAVIRPMPGTVINRVATGSARAIVVRSRSSAARFASTARTSSSRWLSTARSRSGIGAHRTQKRGGPTPRLQQWALGVQTRRGHNKATVAVANKLARIVWAVWTRDVDYEARPALPAAA